MGRFDYVPDGIPITRSEYLNNWKSGGNANLCWIKGEYLISNGAQRENVTIHDNHYGVSKVITFHDGTKSDGVSKADTKKKFVVEYSGYGIGRKILGFTNSVEDARKIAKKFMGDILELCEQKDKDGWECRNVSVDGRCNKDHSKSLRMIGEFTR